MKQNNFDVLIMGAGLAGSTLALQLKRQLPDISVLVIDSNVYPVPNAGFKVGESTVDIAGYYLRKVLDLGEYMEREQLPKYGLRFFLPEGENEDITQRVEIGNFRRPNSKSYQVDRGRLENDLYALMAEQGIAVYDGSKITGFDPDSETKTVQFKRDGQEHTVSGRWLVDASGLSQLIKRKLDLKEDVDCPHFSSWFRVDKQVYINDLAPNANDWLERVPRKARELCTNHLLGEGYWIWIIPLAGGATSIGIVADEAYHTFSDIGNHEKSLSWLQKHEPQFAKYLENLDANIIDFKRFSRFAYSCKQVFSADRWAITGIAGTFTDPFYSPGTDFIAIANTFITQLIEVDLAGGEIDQLVKDYEAGYFRGFDLLLNTIKNQYGIFGHPLAMSCKVVWDATTAWSAAAPIFCNDQFHNCEVTAALANELFVITQLHEVMQATFKRWSTMSFDIPIRKDIIVDTTDNFMVRLQNKLAMPVETSAELIAAVKANKNQLVTLAVELFSLVEGKELKDTPVALLASGYHHVTAVRRELEALLLAKENVRLTNASSELEMA